MTPVPDIRIRPCNARPVRGDGEFILYWMIAFRRTTWNFAMDRAVEWAETLRKPLVVLEAVRCGYPWASDRMHTFLLDGMAENARRLEGTGILYYPFLESKPNAEKGLLGAMAAHACVVVTDDFPCFFLPRMVAAAARNVPVRLETVDSNGLLPMRLADRAFPTAYAFRRFLQKNLPFHLRAFPKIDAIKNSKVPAARGLPREVTAAWPRVPVRLLRNPRGLLAKMPINHDIPPVSATGGSRAAQSILKKFVRDKLDAYPEERNQPCREATSGLSPYLHFGHISAHQVFSEIAKINGWSAKRLTSRATGRRTGWWGMRQAAEAFLDQLVTWRELGFNFCSHRKDYEEFESLPDWALKTLYKHARDRRPYLYSLADFDRARTHDSLWNAAQMQLVREGRIHNYLRMLWGKKILEWTPSPATALEVMVELNNRYALDGRDPNSYSGIFWCLGRYDRPWGPERPVFGKVRYMSSANTARKIDVKEYLRRYAPNPPNEPAEAREVPRRMARK